MFDISCYPSAPPCQLVQTANYAVGGHSDLSVGIYTGYHARSTQGQLKMTHINFAILNSNVTVIYLKFIKNTHFYEVKQKN